MKLFHKTQSKIENITKRGNFEDVFFFGESVHYLLEDWAFTYTVESDDLDFFFFFFFQFQDNVEENALVVRFAEIFDLSLDDAIAVLSNDDDIASHTDDMSDETYVQVYQAKIAKSYGFDGCISEDEQGAVYMIPMFGRENLLNEVK